MNENLNENYKAHNNLEDNSSNTLSNLDDQFLKKIKEIEEKLDKQMDEELNKNLTPKETPIQKIEPEPTFKNSYTEKLNTASKKREEAIKKGSNKYIKYSSIGMEMIGSVLLGGFGGNWLDKKIQLGFPLFTITLILLGLGATFTHLIMQLNADRKEEEEKERIQKIKV